MATKKRYVVVTTDSTRRGVFFGVLTNYDTNLGIKKQIVILEEAQMAVQWSEETHGVLGLAAIGPQPGSRITYVIPKLEINGVTAIMDVTQEAINKWKQQRWD